MPRTNTLIKSTKQELACQYLLSAKTYSSVARMLGISQRTLKNWVRDPAFQKMYAAAKTALLERIQSGLANNALLANEQLRKSMKHKSSDPLQKGFLAVRVIESSINSEMAAKLSQIIDDDSAPATKQRSDYGEECTLDKPIGDSE